MEDSLLPFPLEARQSLGYANGESLQRKHMKFSDDSAFGLASRGNSTHGRMNSYDTIIDKLSVLQDIVEVMSPCWYRESHMNNIFFSSLDSISSIADCVLRKLRGLLMVMSVDCTKLELLGGGNSKELSKQSSGKPVAGSRKKKGKSQTGEKLKNKLQNVVDESSIDRSDKACIGKIGSANMQQSDRNTDEISSRSVNMEQSHVLVLGKEKTKKNRKGRKKRSRCKDSDERRESEGAVKDPAYHELSSGEFDFSRISDISGKHSIVAVSQSLSSLSTECNNLNGTDTQQHSVGCSEGVDHVSQKFHSAGKVIANQPVIVGAESSNSTLESSDGVPRESVVCEAATIPIGRGIDSGVQHFKEKATTSDKFVKTVELNGKSTLTLPVLARPTPCLSYEWPSTVPPLYFQPVNSHILPAADRLHLDVGHNSIRQPYVPTLHQLRNSRTEGGRSRMLSRPLPMSVERQPNVRNSSGFAPSLTCNYDSEHISRRKNTFAQNFSFHGAEKVVLSAKISDDERKFSGESKDLPEGVATQVLMDDCNGQLMSEEELEMHAVPGMDYSQYFGGGSMYWNPSDQPVSGFSRPSSLSSDDGLWAWHEADMNRSVDDMLAISSSYSTNGLTSPPATSFCSPFVPMCSGHQALGYVVSGNEVSGKFLHTSSMNGDSATAEDVSGSLNSISGNIEGRTVDSFYPILRPIIIPSMSKRNNGPKSLCVPSSRQEQSRIKRPLSPVVLCVPRAPQLPPPSPISDSRKHRGFPMVRSGSSSPRQWGMRGWYNDGANVEEAFVPMDGPDVVLSPWRNKNLSATHALIQPLTGALLQDHRFAMAHFPRDQEHPDISLLLQPPELENCPAQKASLCLIHNILHNEIELFCSRVAASNLARKPFINWAVKRVARSLQVMWPRSRTNIFGSNATGLSLPTSDVDLVVCLPPVRNLEPIKEAGILEGRNGIKETCLQHAARYLANQEWVKNDSLRTVENTAIPLIMLVVDVPYDLATSACNIRSVEEASSVAVEQDDCGQPVVVGADDTVSPTFSWSNCDGVKDVKSIRIDISFKSPSHTGLQTTELVKALTEQFPAAAPLALVLKQFLADRSLDQSYSGGLSSYCLVLLVTRFLQHEHHLGRPISKNFGSLLMDFLYFFGNVFDPRRMRISVQGSGLYINRERGYSIDPLYIDDPLFPTNNVGKNCFRIHQCIKAFSEAFSTLENEISKLDEESSAHTRPYRFLSKIVPSIILENGT